MQRLAPRAEPPRGRIGQGARVVGSKRAGELDRPLDPASRAARRTLNAGLEVARDIVIAQCTDAFGFTRIAILPAALSKAEVVLVPRAGGRESAGSTA